MHRPEKFSAGPAPPWAGTDTVGDLTDDSGGIVGRRRQTARSIPSGRIVTRFRT